MSTPSMPKPEEMKEPAPPPKPVEPPAPPTPAPELVNAKAKAPKVSAPKSQRAAQQQASRGTNALKIKMNTGTPSKGGLNIPT